MDLLLILGLVVLAWLGYYFSVGFRERALARRLQKGPHDAGFVSAEIDREVERMRREQEAMRKSNPRRW